MILLMSFYHLKSSFSNQLIKINEFFLSSELWFETFVCHLSQSWLFVILRKRYRFKFLADNKTSLLPKIKMKDSEIVKGQQPLQWHKDWSLFLSWDLTKKDFSAKSLCNWQPLQNILFAAGLVSKKLQNEQNLGLEMIPRSEMLQVNISTSQPVSNNYLVPFYLTKVTWINF